MRTNRFAFICIIALIAAMTLPAQAQWLRMTTPFNAQVHNFTSGTSDFFAATFGSGIFRLDASGANFVGANGNLSNKEVLAFAETGSARLAGCYRKGIARSIDGGSTWTIVAPDTDVVGMCTIGNYVFAGSINNGLTRSTNSGADWARLKTGIAPSREQDMGAFAAIGTTLFAGYLDGLIASTDRGNTWTTVTLPGSAGAVLDMVSCGSFLYVMTQGQVYRSGSLGATWDLLTVGNPCLVGISCLATADTRVFAGTSQGVYVSPDNGQTWDSVGGKLDQGISAMGASKTALFLAGYDSTVWYRPLSQMTGSTAVSQSAAPHISVASYPNPFSHSTTITFTSNGGHTEFSIVNQLGIEVARLFEGELAAGEHSFRWDATGMPPGMYECVIRTGAKVEKVGLLLLR